MFMRGECTPDDRRLELRPADWADLGADGGRLRLDEELVHDRRGRGRFSKKRLGRRRDDDGEAPSDHGVDAQVNDAADRRAVLLLEGTGPDEPDGGAGEERARALRLGRALPAALPRRAPSRAQRTSPERGSAPRTTACARSRHGRDLAEGLDLPMSPRLAPGSRTSCSTPASCVTDDARLAGLPKEGLAERRPALRRRCRSSPRTRLALPSRCRR